MNDKKAIVNYYDNAKISYQDAWHLDKCMAMHFGIWDKGVKNLQEALIRENKILAEIINLQSNDYGLDAGCGVGGSSIYLAQHFNCKMHGITLSENQKESAENSAKKLGVENNTKFSVDDFHATQFKDNTFDFVWMLESFCHASDSKKVLNEMFRVLKPGGKIIIADVFLSKQSHSKKHLDLMTSWLNSWAVQFVEKGEKIPEFMKESGFENIYSQNFTKSVTKSINKLNLFGRGALALGGIKRFFGKSYGNKVTIQNSRGAVLSYQTLKKGIWDYLIFSANKPKLVDK